MASSTATVNPPEVRSGGDDSPPLLRMRGIEKMFPGVHALKGVDLDLAAGEVLALVGENGAGKSTLIKVLSGAHRADAGTIEISGEVRDFSGPADARAAGVAVIYQEFNLVPAMSVADNLFLGRERTRAGFVALREERRAALELFERVGVAVEPSALCRQLTVAQQQVVEVARALSESARIVVMDEPSATLTPREVERLFDIVRDLRARGLGVIYISHRLEEIFAIADRVVVMRDGEVVGRNAVYELNRGRIIEMMVGRRIDQEFPREEHAAGPVRLAARNLSRGRRVRGVSLAVRAGEIVGLTGLVGSGRTETARLLFGADRPDSGTIELDGCRLDLRGPKDAIRAGIGLLTEDRKSQGLVLGLSARDNFSLPNLGRLSRWAFVRHRAERSAFGRFVDALRIRLASQDTPVRNLSGGNQQKVVLAKWLERNCEVVLFDEPTRGIDVGAKYEIYVLMNRLAREGKAVLMISSELPEVLGMCDRILVMHEGRITGEIEDVPSATQEDILELAVR